MQTFETLTIRRVFSGSDGKFIEASYEGWTYEYRFYVQEDGRIKGRTNTETWVDLSANTAEIIARKFKHYLRVQEQGGQI